ncbi:MAG: CPBP family intramembrane glutamic endopeptidase [Bacteroidales bacterium]
MKYPLSHHPFTQLITLVFIMLFCVIICSLLSLILAIPVFDLSLSSLLNNLESGNVYDNIQLFKFLQTFQTIGLFVIPPFIFSWLYSTSSLEYLKVKTQPSSNSLLLVPVLLIAGIPFIGYLGQLNQNIEFPAIFEGLENWLMQREETVQGLTEKFLVADTPSDLLLNLLMIAVLPAIGEEFVFRGIVQKIFHKWLRNVHFAVIISAFIFSAMHIQFYGLLPRFFLGLLFGYFLVWSGSMWLPVLGHFVNNATAVIYYYFVQQQSDKYTEDISSFEMQPAVILFSIITIAALCYMIYYAEVVLKNK